MKASKINRIKKLKNLEQKVYNYESKLNGCLQKLASAASLELGFEVVADLCPGNEIEFRIYDDNGVPDTKSCIILEEVIKKIK